MASHNVAGHNASPQTGVAYNSDPALDISHEHAHAHLHHSANAEKGRTDNVVYTAGTTHEPSVIPNPDPQDDYLRRRNQGSTDKKDLSAVDVEMEKGAISPIPTSTETADDPQRHKLSGMYARFKPAVHGLIWLLFTGWWVAGLVLHRKDKNWVVPFLIWLCVTIRIITFYVPITIVTKPMHFVWNNTAVRATEMIPEKLRTPLAAAGTVAVIITGSFASKESADNTRANRAVSLFGLVVLMAGLWATSSNRKAIKWHTVIVGMLTQFVVALFVLRTQVGFDIFNFIASLAREMLHFAGDGTAFLTSADTAKMTWFLIGVIPPIIFFVALVQLLYYWGLVQWFVGKFATFFFWSMRVSGAEAVVAAASPFIGQGESAMLIKPFIPHLTKSELHQVMCSGFATIAGSVLVAYIGMGINPQALVSSCIMSIPASLAISHMRYPETEETLTAGRVVIPDDDDHKAANGLHAFANGAWLGIKIAGMIIATLLVILALLGLVNGLLTWFGRYINLTGEYDLTIELIVGYICYPIAFLLGVPRNGDLLKVARLIGVKIIANEFVAYQALVGEAEYATLSPRSQLIATYALCGFGNIGSLGTQIGVLSQIAPGRSGDVSRLALSALITGVLSTLTSASIAGLLVTDQSTYISTAVTAAANATVSAV